MKFMKFAFLSIFLSFIPTIHAIASKDIVKKYMLSDLDFIKNSFEVKYAPMLWKQEFVHWDLSKEYNAAKSKLLSLKNPSIKDCQIIFKEFFQATKDYHVSISFFSTESATLPFMGLSAEGHYYVVYVDSSSNSNGLDVGDEILTFNDQPIMQVISHLRDKEIGQNTKETDQSLAELMLTCRSGSIGHVVPKGEVVMKVRKKQSSRLETVKLVWDYHPEKITDPLRLTNKLMDLPTQCNVFKKTTPREETFKSFFNKMMVAPAYLNTSSPQTANYHRVGSRKSYIPELGKIIWKSEEDDLLDAYIFQIKDDSILPPGKKALQVGYIRIPHYSAGEKEAAEFQELVSFMDFKTDALVIDQINNPGGSVFYMYALASMLTEKPMTAPKHKIALTQQEVAVAGMILEALECVKEGDDASAQALFGENLGGYEINYNFVKVCRLYCHHLINEWNQGHFYTSPIHLYGIDNIQPHSKDRYTKPILVLINHLDFSAADFFPAILQDNHRATILGTRTAGAGGFVLAATYPNLLGVQSFHFTGSLAVRDQGDPLENLGVKPDISYSLTRIDLENNYSSYVRKILESICQLSR